MTQILNPQFVVEFVNRFIDDDEHEQLIAILIDCSGRIKSLHWLGSGTLNSVSISTKEIVRLCVVNNTRGVILVHTHPSGDLVPSESDKDVTRRLSAALKDLEMKLADHLIVYKNQYTSIIQTLDDENI